MFPALVVELLTLCAVFLSTAEKLEGPVVQTQLGRLRGQYMSTKEKEAVFAFLGVPFARPPVGPLRLARPQPTEGWEGVRDASEQPLMCIQDRQATLDWNEDHDIPGELPEISEDCLYLNIYTPAKVTKDTKFPVMVFIHGGGLKIGSASMFDGSALAAYQDVVVVVIQYRLGLLGFFSTGDAQSPGNLGLLDQVEALKWVQKHIHNFRGDPDLVTIFGHSAGAASVSFQLLSPLSHGLFHRAISQSGTAAMDQILLKQPLLMAQMAANASGCDITSTEKIASCMKNLDINSIVALSENKMLSFAITIDGYFLTSPVDDIFQSQKFLKIPFMAGINDDEGGFVLPNSFAPPNWTEGMERAFVKNVLSMIFLDSPGQLEAELLLEEYIGSSEDPIEVRDAYTAILGDLLFAVPLIETANAHTAAGAPLYLYEYARAPRSMKKKRPSFVGCDHGDEVYIVLGRCLCSTEIKNADACPEEEVQLSKIIMSYWGNFARTGSPNGRGLVEWPQYGAEGDYLYLGIKQEHRLHMKKDVFTFMTQTLPEQVSSAGQGMQRAEL